MFETIFEFVKNNSFLSGGAILGAMGFLIAYLRNLPMLLWDWLKRRFIIELDIPDRDEVFKWLNSWLAAQEYQKRCRRLTVSTYRKKERNERPPSFEDTRVRPEICLSPAPGFHYFFYRRRLVILHRDRKESGSKDRGAFHFGFQETFNLKVFSRNRQIVRSLLEEARELAHPRTEDRVSIYVPRYSEWQPAMKKVPRALASVLTAGSIKEDLYADIREFLESEKWYNDLGIPYRRGYLLCGPPGNGKSSLVTALASELGADICALNLSASGLSDEGLVALMLDFPERAFLLMEDIDCVFNQRDKKDDKDTVTFSGLLNAVDGVMAGEGRVLFLTTNHVDRLDPALIRPGRCDRIIHVNNAIPSQAAQLFLRFFPGELEAAAQFASHLPPETLSMAAIQGHLLKYRKNMEKALTNFAEMVE